MFHLLRLCLSVVINDRPKDRCLSAFISVVSKVREKKGIAIWETSKGMFDVAQTMRASMGITNLEFCKKILAFCNHQDNSGKTRNTKIKFTLSARWIA